MSQPIFLVKDGDNSVIFPQESGRFVITNDYNAIFEVNGSSSSRPAPDDNKLPFGAYSHYPVEKFQMPHPPPFTPKKRLIKKNILLSSFSLRGQGTSSSSKIQHTVITNVTVTLDPACGQCNIKEVCNKVREQVGFEVVLLDSKCYPLVSNGDTSDPDFWKSNHCWT